MEIYQKLKKLYKLSDERKWERVGSRTEFFFKSGMGTDIEICRFGIRRYYETFNKITFASGEEIYKLKYFQQIFSSAEEIGNTNSRIIQDATIDYLDGLLLEVIREECKDLIGVKLIFHSAIKPDEVEENSVQKRIYIV